MKDFILSLSCLIFLWACSAKDDGVGGSENDADLGIELLDSSFVEILLRHEIDFNYIQSSAIVYAVKKDY